MPGLWGSEFNTDWILSFIIIVEYQCPGTLQDGGIHVDAPCGHPVLHYTLLCAECRWLCCLLFCTRRRLRWLTGEGWSGASNQFTKKVTNCGLCNSQKGRRSAIL